MPLREYDAWRALKAEQMQFERDAKAVKEGPAEKELTQAEIDKIVSDFKAAQPEQGGSKMLIPGTGRTDQVEYNRRTCPACGSDRRSTALQVVMLTPNGDFAGRAACRNAWHLPKQSDARLGFRRSTPSENRAVGRGDAVKSGM